MKHRRFFIAIWIALTVYGTGSLLLGVNGLLAFRVLKREQLRLEKNIAKLRITNDGLNGSLGALRSDPDTVALLAKEMGYADADIQALRISGLPNASHQTFPAGEQLKSVLPTTLPSSQLRMIALFAGLAFWVISWVRRGTIRDPKRPISTKM